MELHSRQLRKKKPRNGSHPGWAFRRVLQRLNEELKPVSVQRVQALLDSLRRAEELRLQLYEHTLGPHYHPETDDDGSDRAWFSDPEIEALNAQHRKLMEEIVAALQRYKWTPTFHCDGFAMVQRGYTWKHKSKQDDWENLAVEYLLGRASYPGGGRSPADILHIRKCRNCAKWFYAATEHQTSCSEQCRKQFHAETPQAKQSRAEYMRDYRRLQKSRSFGSTKKTNA